MTNYCLKNADHIKNDGIAVSSENKMTEIERLFNNGRMTTNVVSRSSLLSKSLVTPPLDSDG